MRIRIRNGRDARGFSLVETLVVVAIALCISAYAIPNIMQGVANLRLRGAASTLSGFVQNCRMQAIKRNTNKAVHFTVLSGGSVAFIDDPATTTLASTNTLQAQLGSQISLVRSPSGTGAPTLLDNSIFGGTDPLTTDVTFNARGLPCKYASGSCTTGFGYTYYFTDARVLSHAGWAAISVTPAGRVKTWVWNGSSWGD